MIVLALLLAVAQDGVWTVRPAAPTVGDTVVLERLVPAAAGALGRTRPLEPSELVQPLARPAVESRSNGVLVRHRVALFAPGRHAVPMPAVEVLHPDGTVEVIVGDSAVVTVAAVIPDTVAVAAPMPSLGPVARPARSPARAVLPVAAVLAVLAIWAGWRRRPPAVLADVEPVAPPPDMPLMRWLQCGERRAVATIAARRIRSAGAGLAPASANAPSAEAWGRLVAAASPSPVVAELTDVLAALERARFAPLGADDLVELVDRTDVALGRLGAAPPEASAS